ncbi:MAG: DNA primase [Planctomycetota bacterium]
MRTDNAAPYGFRVVGGRHGLRRLVDWQAALAGHAACEARAQTDRECYLSAFTFGDELRDHLAETGSTKGYRSPCGAAWLWLDLDDPDNPERALDAARRLTAGLVDRYAIDGDELLVFYSGAKGYHVGLPLAVCGSPAPSERFHRIAQSFAEAAAERQGVGIDMGVYDRVRLFRAPNSRHPKTGRHKRRLAFDELLALSADAIARMAETPGPFDLPAEPALDFTAVADWNAAAEAVEADNAARAERRAATDGATLNRRTLDFLRDGAPVGDRHRLLYSAAANLAELGADYRLAVALLNEPALDSGLPPSDVARQIRCGVESVRSGGPEPPATRGRA